MVKFTKEVPWCTVFLVTCALLCNFLVLQGNLATARAIEGLGHSSKGWAEVGQHFADAMDKELNGLMTETTGTLSNVITKLQSIQHSFDSVLGMAGSVADDMVSLYRGDITPLVEESGRHKEHANVSALLATDVKPVELKDEDEIMYMMQTPPIRSTSHSARPVPEAAEQPGSLEPWRSRHHHVKLVLESRSCMLENEGLPPVENHEAILVSMDNMWDKIAGGNAKNLSLSDFKANMREALTSVVDELVKTLSTQIDYFFLAIRPALLQIGKWLVQFGDAVSGALQDFSVTLDTVQKILDQVMQQLNKAKQKTVDDSDIRFEVFTLFDNGNKGFITLKDVEVTANTYKITSLYGKKAGTLYNKYDANNDGKLDPKEFANFVRDDTIPGVMAVMLREVAKRLLTIAGNLASAKYRDDVANEVFQYLSLQAAKNMTKVGWVCQTLTNRSLPAAFSADMLKNAAMNDDMPNKITSVDVGRIVVGTMAEFNAPYLAELVILLTDPKFWQSEGFDPHDQPRVVERVVQWTIMAPQGTEVINDISPNLLEQAAPIAKERNVAPLAVVPEILANFTKRESDTFLGKIQANESKVNFYRSNFSKVLRHKILGGVDAANANKDPTQKAATRGGQLAVPATREFAARLSNNATATSQTYNHICFHYTSTSTDATNSFAGDLGKLIKKVQSFTTNMAEFCTPAGIDRMKKMIEDFAERTGHDLVNILMDQVDIMLPADDGQAVVEKKPTQDVVGDIAAKVHQLLSSLQLILPTVVDDLKFARKAVASIASPMKGIFATFETNGPPIFITVSDLYGKLWSVYFALLSSLVVGVLIYGFWSSGFCSSPSDTGSGRREAYEPPQSFCDRICCCCSCFASCCRSCHDSTIAFWAVVFLLEIFVLVLFVVSMVLCLLGGLKMFIAAGCSAIYLLGDDSVCQGAIHMLKSFVTTFMDQHPGPLTNVCHDKNLLTCSVLGQEFMKSVIFTTIGSILAVVFLFQLIVEAAIQHEKARWRKVFEDEANGEGDNED